MRLYVLLASCALAAGCQRASEQAAATNDERSEIPHSSATPVPLQPSQSAEAATNNETALAEPNGPIDPESPEAAGQVVQSYGALIEQSRWKESSGLWGDPAQAEKFQAQLAQFGDVHLEIGNPGDAEGAAGSIYLTMPVIFYGDLKNGQPFRRSADVILRRVNDVPGSSEAQRRWHIERIDWAA